MTLAASPSFADQAYQWYEEARQDPNSPRRTLRIEALTPTLTTVVAAYDFDDCSIVYWEARVVVNTINRDIVELDCRLSGAQSLGQPQWTALLNDMISGGDVYRTMQVDWLNASGVVARSFRYDGAFPVRYVFPSFDAISRDTMTDAFEVLSAAPTRLL